MLMIYKNIVPFIELFHKNFLKNRERYKHYITEFRSTFIESKLYQHYLDVMKN